MNKQAWQQFIEKLKRPDAIIAIVTCVGVVLCIVFFVYGLMPELKETRAAESELEQAEKQLAELLGVTDPQTISEEQVRELLEQVPLTNAGDQIINSFILLQVQTGAKIVSMTNREPEEETKEDLLAQYLAEQAQNQNTVSEAQKEMDQSNNRAQSTTAEEEEELETSFLEYETEMEIVGTFPQIRSFIDKLTTDERLFRITAWSLNPGEQKGMLSASLTVAYYAAPDYSTLFGDYIDEKSYNPNGTRQDPTLTDEEFNERLETGP